jgi:hypothetical protein
MRPVAAPSGGRVRGPRTAARAARLALIVAAAISLAGNANAAAAGRERKFTLAVCPLGTERIRAYGSERDYAPGVNDFPVTPAHSTAVYGASLTFRATRRIAAQADVRYAGRAPVLLRDPSDGDEVSVDTARRWSLCLNLVYRFLDGVFQPWIAAGGGFEKLLAADQTVRTRAGYQAVFPAPEDDFDLLAQAGTGAAVHLTRTWGLWIDLRYVHAFSRPHAVDSFVGLVGLLVSF